MASQISHIVYAKKYFDQLEAGKIEASGKINPAEFILGCVFPDVRKADPNIKRMDTHLRFSPLNLNFKNLSSFEAGWKFHLYCDMRREEILNKYKFYSLVNAGEFHVSAAKLLEDELIYENYNNWEKIIHYFNHPPFPELANLSITPETFRLWYAIVAKYIEKKPKDKDKRIFLRKLPRLAEHTDEIMRSLKILRENKKSLEILNKLNDEIV